MILFRRIGGEPLNFLFRDGLEMILDWCKENPPQASDKEFIKLASSIVEFVAKNVAHGETEAVKDNKVRIIQLCLMFSYYYVFRKCFERCSTSGKAYR